MKHYWLLVLSIMILQGCTERIPINSEAELSNSECDGQNGRLASIQNDNTACKSTEIDLGRVTDVKCKCHCCKPS